MNPRFRQFRRRPIRRPRRHVALTGAVTILFPIAAIGCAIESGPAPWSWRLPAAGASFGLATGPSGMTTGLRCGAGVLDAAVAPAALSFVLGAAPQPWLASGVLTAFMLRCSPGGSTCFAAVAPVALSVALSGRRGALLLAGYDASVARGFEDWAAQPFAAAHWSGVCVPAVAWLGSAGARQSWTDVPEPAETWQPVVMQPKPWTRD